jgi:uncharacterized protein YbbC (DUF1343 family)
MEFVVLDRPNPLGGLRVKGPLVEPRWISFVGQIPVPHVHGVTCGELARMINGKGSVPGCDPKVVATRGWSRNLSWDDTGRRWISTSPNIPRWDSRFYYVATGLIRELYGPETGVGAPRPFEILPARGINASSFTQYMDLHHLAGITFTEYRSGPVGRSYLHIEPAARKFDGD